MYRITWKEERPEYHESTDDPRIFQSNWVYRKGIVEPIKEFVARALEAEPQIYVHSIALPYNETNEDAKEKLVLQGLKEMVRNCDYLEEHGQWEGLEDAEVTEKFHGREIPG